jgi:carboxypeptidase C (cathepsin A)
MARPIAALWLLLILFASAVRADDKPIGGLPARVATHHSITVGDRHLGYDAIAETLPVINAKGTPTAAIFTISYLADASPGALRPVSFAFNGGPGAASVFLHLGALGPRIMETPQNGATPNPPVRLIDNPSTWLAFTDLVFVDPVGTGYSHGLGKGENPDKPFFDVHADLDSLSAVVRLWLTRHERWGSPIYLVGESYGGFRAAALAHDLPHEASVTVSGIVLVSPALDLSMLHQDDRDLLAAAFYLPSYAATAAALDGRPADLPAVERFALSDYLVGLAGLAGRPAADDAFLAKVAGVIGLPDDLVRQWRGRVPRQVFAREIRRAQGEIVSLYDGTIARPAATGDGRGRRSDPLLQPAAAAFGAAFNAYAADELGYHTDLAYRVLAPDVSHDWNWEGAGGDGEQGLAMASLQQALLDHPATRVLIVGGRFDLVTPYFASRWLIDQLPLPAATRAGISLRVYDGGHMMYMRPQSRTALARDAAILYSPPGAAPLSQ